MTASPEQKPQKAMDANQKVLQMPPWEMGHVCCDCRGGKAAVFSKQASASTQRSPIVSTTPGRRTRNAKTSTNIFVFVPILFFFLVLLTFEF
jgi:hypothetical protein